MTADYPDGTVLMDDTGLQLAARVAAAIERSGMEKRAVAEAAGMNPTALSKCLSGRRRFQPGELQQIADLTMTDVAALLGPDRGAAVPVPAIGRLTAAVQQLWAAAGSPGYAALAAQVNELAPHGSVTRRAVEDALTGRRLTGWTPLRRITAVLGGDPDQLHPLWLAARLAARQDQPAGALVITDALAARLVRRVKAELMRPHGDRGAGLVHFDPASEGAGERAAHWLATAAVKAVIMELLFPAAGSGRHAPGPEVADEVGGGDLV